MPYNIYDPLDKKEPISFHDPYDIPGAQVGTLIKGMKTDRATNPITPNYRLLDGAMAPVPVYNPRTGLDTRTIPMETWSSSAGPQLKLDPPAGDSAALTLESFGSGKSIPDRSPGAEGMGSGGMGTNMSMATQKVAPSSGASAAQKLDAFMD